MAGVFGEPAGVTGFAGLRKLLHQGKLNPDERIVVLMTGNGLKDVDSAIKATQAPALIEPTVEALRRHLSQAT